MEFIIGIALGAFIQWKWDIADKAGTAIAWVKGLFNRNG